MSQALPTAGDIRETLIPHVSSSPSSPPPRTTNRSTLSSLLSCMSIVQSPPSESDDMDAPPPLPPHPTLKDRLNHYFQPERNPSKATCLSIPTAGRMPEHRITVCVAGGDTAYGSHLVQGLTNPAYEPAFSVVQLPLPDLHALSVEELTVRLAGVHTLVIADVPVVLGEDGVVVDTTDDAQWARTLDACKAADVKRVVPSPFSFDAAPAKRWSSTSPLIRRQLARHQQLIDSQLDYTLITPGILTELLFSPLYGVDLPRGQLRAIAGWTTKFATTTLDDLARFLPEVLLATRSAHKETVRLASVMTSYEKMLEMMLQVADKPIQRVDVAEVSPEQTKREMDTQTALTLMLQTGKGMQWAKGDSWNAQRIPHLATTRLHDWLPQHLNRTAAAAADSVPFQPNLHPSVTGLAPLTPPADQLYVTAPIRK